MRRSYHIRHVFAPVQCYDLAMDREQIVAILIQEPDRLSAAIEALRGAPKKGPAIETTPKKKRHVSAAARKKMALGQKKRWAALKAGK